MAADELLKSDGFKSYVHLMAKYDDILWADRHENGLNSLWVHYQDDPDAQVYAAVLVWTKAKRPRSYVEKALGIYGVPIMNGQAPVTANYSMTSCA
ncbi:unnamed protein product [Phytophthora lilii]|uniref:Unnamed protein product n=1 Tax=Phytophthora lilii TaxID=2077276 RepID=A0A9W6TE49_9STRA|nr:unnamed protein product [Phytophthora lilii]